MFLPRASTSTSSNSNDPLKSTSPSSSTPFQQSPKRYGLTKASVGAGGQGVAAWTQPTTAPASMQVHFHYLAGRYRDLSHERGLGLSSSGLPSSSSVATLGGILEGDYDDVNSIEGDARSIYIQTSPNGKTLSASNSLRAIARKTGVGKQHQKTSSYTTRLQDIFGGSRLGGNDSGQQDESTSEAKVDPNNRKRELLQNKIPSASHKSKHISLRGYAEERMKAQELIESRIELATDTGRLKWEARAAMLNSSFALAILLYTRAAQLGSISAALSLAHLYATGLIRGNKPVVILVHRNPLQSLAWTLEAARILHQRTGARSEKQGASASWSRAEEEQPAQIVALIARLLRCKEAGLTAASESKLPSARRRKSSKKKGEEEGGLVWESVCGSMEWLDKQLVVTISPALDDGHSKGPDDDEHNPMFSREVQARTHVVLIEALVALRRYATAHRRDEDDKAFSQVKTCWRSFSESLSKEGSPHDLKQGNLSMICDAFEKLLNSNLQPREEQLEELVEALDESLAESKVPVAIFACESSTMIHLESPSKRLREPLSRKGRSLEQSAPVYGKGKREDAKIPTLLMHRTSSEVKPTTINAFGENVSAKQNAEFSQSFSLHGLEQRPRMSSSASMAQLESLTLRPRHKKRGSVERVRRPSSVMSASPSLLFPTREEAEEKTSSRHAKAIESVGMSSTSSVASSLWKAGPLQGRQASNKKGTRDRAASLYGAASVAKSEKVNTFGSNTADYDVDLALSRQQTRRRRGDSNASISTLVSVLSVSPSISASVTGSEYAKAQFLSPSPSISTNNGLDLRAGEAAESLRRIRKASISNQTAREIPTVPHLSDTLEDLIANSASYRAANAKFTTDSNYKARPRRDSNASMKSLTAFTGNNQRQTSYGDMRSPSLFQGRASSVLGITAMTALRSPTLSATSSYFNITPQNANATMQSRPRLPSTSAVGSLRLLERQASSLSIRKVNEDKGTTKQTKQTKQSPPLQGVTKTTTTKASIGPTVNQHRSFEACDPTHSQTASPAGSIIHHQHNNNNDNNNNKSKSQHNSNSTNHFHNTNPLTALDPALAEVEERSGLKTISNCMVCQTKVVNAPVSKSGDVFCSRECRMEMKRKRSSEAKVSEDKRNATC